MYLLGLAFSNPIIRKCLDIPEKYKSQLNTKFHRHFDNRFLNFLRQIQPILRNVKLGLAYGDTEGDANRMRAALVHMLPLFDGIHQMVTSSFMMPVLKQLLRDKFKEVKVLKVFASRDDANAAKPIMDWLTSSNKPKLLKFCSINEPTAILEAVRKVKLLSFFINFLKQFMTARALSTFAINFNTTMASDLSEFQLENGIGEELLGRKNGEKFQGEN